MTKNRKARLSIRAQREALFNRYVHEDNYVLSTVKGFSVLDAAFLTAYHYIPTTSDLMHWVIGLCGLMITVAFFFGLLHAHDVKELALEQLTRFEGSSKRVGRRETDATSLYGAVFRLEVIELRVSRIVVFIPVAFGLVWIFSLITAALH